MNRIRPFAGPLQILFVPLLAIFCPSLVGADDREKPKPLLWPHQAKAQQTVLTQASREERGLTTESSSVTLKELPAEDRNLDEQQQKRLRVTWEKPERKVRKRGQARSWANRVAHLHRHGGAARRQSPLA